MFRSVCSDRHQGKLHNGVTSPNGALAGVKRRSLIGSCTHAKRTDKDVQLFNLEHGGECKLAVTWGQLQRATKQDKIADQKNLLRRVLWFTQPNFHTKRMHFGWYPVLYCLAKFSAQQLYEIGPQIITFTNLLSKSLKKKTCEEKTFRVFDVGGRQELKKPFYMLAPIQTSEVNRNNRYPEQICFKYKLLSGNFLSKIRNL